MRRVFLMTVVISTTGRNPSSPLVPRFSDNPQHFMTSLPHYFDSPILSPIKRRIIELAKILSTEVSMSDENLNPDAPLHIRGLNHLTMPVKDRYRAARFYIVVLGAEAHHESAPDRAAKGLARSLQTGVRLAPGFEVDLFEQSYGQPDWNRPIRIWHSIRRLKTWPSGRSILKNGRCRSSDR